MDLILEATRKSGGIYLYANQQGCDGDRLYYDGCAMIVVNGEIVAQGSQFSLNDVEVVVATVDLQEVRSYRYPPSRRMQAAVGPQYPRVHLDLELANKGEEVDPSVMPSTSRSARFHEPEEEIALGPVRDFPFWHDDSADSGRHVGCGTSELLPYTLRDMTNTTT